MSNKIKKFQAAKSSKLSKAKAVLHKLRYVGYLAILLVGAYTVSEISFLINLTTGITVEKRLPKHKANIEIVYMKGNLLTAETVANNLTNSEDKDLTISVIGMEALEGNTLHKSLVISRNRNIEIAQMIAEKIGISTSEVVYRAPIERDMSPAVTLVLGEDLEDLIKERTEAKEI